MKTALTIAGFDPTSGAGITADLKVFHTLKVYGVGVVSSLTAQNTLGVTAIESVPRSYFREQMRGILDDIAPDAAKTGMIYEKDVIRLVCSEIDRGRIRNLVVDPVITSTSGKLLIRKDAMRELIHELIPRALIVTPNIPEAAEIAGMGIRDVDDMKRAAERIQAFGPEHVVVTGGHLLDAALDVHYDGENFFTYRAKKKQGWYHGTGCVFSAAITAHVALGRDVRDAVQRAKDLVRKAIEKNIRIGKGMSILNI